MSRISIKGKADLPKELWPLWEKMQGYGAFENQGGRDGAPAADLQEHVDRC